MNLFDNPVARHSGFATACSFLFFALGTIAGSGCGQTPYQPPPRLVEYPEEETKLQAATTEPKKVAATPATAPKQVAKSAVPAQSVGGDGEDDTTPYTPVAKPLFPLNYGDWLPDDFKRARQKRWPKLAEAVRELATANVYNPDLELNARLLSELLEAPPAESQASAPQKKLAVGYDDIDEPVAVFSSAIPGLGPAIVDALGANGAAEARAALKRILLGKQSSDIDERTLCMATLKSLIDHYDSENEKILLAVLTVPDSIRPAGQSKYTADQLHADCVRAIGPVATADFRLKLAQRMARGVSSPASQKRDLSLLLATDRANLPAKVELMTSGLIDAADRQSLERDLMQMSQQINEQLFRATAGDWDRARNAPATPARKSYDDGTQIVALAGIATAAPCLWRKEFVTALAARVVSEDELESRDSLLQLAASLPSDVIRTALLRRWKTNWASDVGALGNLGSNFLDPGLVVVFKQLPREMPAGNPRAPARQYPDSPQGQKLAREAAARKSWLRLSETYTQSLMDHCRQFAEHRATSGAAANTTQTMKSVADFDQFLNSSGSEQRTNAGAQSGTSESRPFELDLRHPKDARPKLVYRSSWPEDLLGRLDGAVPSPIELCYVRLEVDGDGEAITSNYSRQLRSPITRQVKNGRWLDSLKDLDDDRIASTDVFITRADRSTEGAARGVTEKFIVEILRVTVADMSAKMPPPATVSRQP